MHDARRVRVRDRRKNRKEHFGCPRHIEPPLGNEKGSERRPVHELHDEIRTLALETDVVDIDNVRMIEAGGDAPLPGEARDGYLVGAKLRVKHLQRDALAEIRVLGLVDASRCAPPELSENAIAPDERR
jgi:hypothetical protein